MGDVVSIVAGRTIPRRALPKPVECTGCGEDIETARLQSVVPKPKRCIACQRAYERNVSRALEGARDRDIVIIRR